MTEFWKTIPHSMFDFADYYDRIAESLPDNSNIAEVGVADGASSIYLTEKLVSLGKKFKLRMIDSLDYGHTDQLKTILDNVQKSGLSEYIDIIPVDSLNASLKFPDHYFDFVFLDSGHTYELTKAEIRLWSRKIKCHGYLAGHDYQGHIEVNQAVNEVFFERGFDDFETDKGYGVWQTKIYDVNDHIR